jgi:hypothetical protein
MADKTRIAKLLTGALALALVEFTGAVALNCTAISPAQAQFGDFFGRPRQQPQRGGSFFQQLFGNPQSEPEQQVDYSRAPLPKKPDPNIVPTTTIMVLGDGMADWLAYGLEDALSESPEISILRRAKQHSGLVRYDFKGDMDWWHAARDILAKDKVDYVVMMIGVADRQNIRLADPPKDDKKKGADKKNEVKKDADKKDADKKDEKKADADKSAQSPADAEGAQPNIIAPEPGKKVSGVVEFRSDQWAEIYSRRIDEMIAALKSKGVPVFWVGLPAIRGPKSTADASYLNDLYRARAERAGITYIDIWDGFVDEKGAFTYQGPDYEGQVRRLRSGDGVYFTRFGARKVALYVERELRRFMSNRTAPITIPQSPQSPQTPDAKGGPVARPLAGPVIPLTVSTDNASALMGGPDTRPVHTDPIATRVLTKGEALSSAPGRADDFTWPRSGDSAATEPVNPVAAAASARAEPANAAQKGQQKKSAQPAKDAKTAKDNKTAQAEAKQQQKPAQTTPRPQQSVQQRPRYSNPFGGWFR